jgi:hypothetical protein
MTQFHDAQPEAPPTSHSSHTSHSSDTSYSSELDPAENFPPDVQPVENPFRCIIRGVEADVLYVLGRSKVARSGSDIAFNTGRSKSQVQKVLIRFAQNKIIDRQEFDGWSWNCLNEMHPLTPIIRLVSMMEFDESLVQVPRQAWSPPMWQPSPGLENFAKEYFAMQAARREAEEKAAGQNSPAALQALDAIDE